MNEEEKKAIKFFYNLRRTIDESNMLFDEEVNVKHGKETIKQITTILNIIEKLKNCINILDNELKERDKTINEKEIIIEKLQKENEKLKNEVMEKDLEIIGKEEYTKASMKEIIEQYYTANEECILIQKVKDKIENLQNEKEEYYSQYKIDELNDKIQVLQELLEGDN